ncbi:ANTAR domain-containing protein [Streptomyces sp. NPDC005574]|uniref:ANTAR domain-containing protein n=1 Tax=Streptomyces sp. NPDC005574 TaxID=3156891 RepID=UPI0033B4CCC1
MSCDREPASPPAVDLARENERLRRENEQLHRALSSHAVVDQAIGVLVCMGRLDPQDGFVVLREVSQRTNTKLSGIAEQIVKHAQGAPLEEAVGAQLDAALARHT